MAKIAVVFLLVVLVAICNGSRVPREAPAAQPSVPAEIKPLLDAATKFFSEENFAKFKDTSAKIQKESQDLGEKASGMVSDWLKKLGDILEEKQKPAA